MSALNLVILALLCVKLSSGQGLVYQPTDRPTDLPTDEPKDRHDQSNISPLRLKGGIIRLRTFLRLVGEYGLEIRDGFLKLMAKVCNERKKRKLKGRVMSVLRELQYY